ncbi:MAG: hypothetical protein WA709_28375 [Stellaceae bacterium]
MTDEPIDLGLYEQVCTPTSLPLINGLLRLGALPVLFSTDLSLAALVLDSRLVLSLRRCHIVGRCLHGLRRGFSGRQKRTHSRDKLPKIRFQGWSDRIEPMHGIQVICQFIGWLNVLDP